jgi:hypothetical protein
MRERERERERERDEMIFFEDLDKKCVFIVKTRLENGIKKFLSI